MMTLPEAFDPIQCALLVMDCQPVVLSAIDNAGELIRNINRATAVVRQHGGHVVFVRVALNDLDYLKIPPTNKVFAPARKSLRFHADSTVTAIHPGLHVEDGDTIVRKTRMGSLSTTNLDERLTNLGVYTLILAGAHTSGAILSTVCDAADRDYQLVVLSDCIADANRDAHRVLMKHVLPRQAEISTAAGLGRLLGCTARKVG
jgi:nicotinamidase-related amidase